LGPTKMKLLTTGIAALCLFFSACASTDRGKAIQQTAVGATLATSGTVGLAVSTVAGGVGIALANESRQSQQAFEAVTAYYVAGALIATATLGLGALLLWTAVERLDMPPQAQVIERAVEAPRKAKPKTALVTTSKGIATAKVAATLIVRDRLISSSFFVSGDPKHLGSSEVVWSVDIRSSAWRFKDCPTAIVVDGGVQPAAASYGGQEDGGGVVERFVLTLGRPTAVALADADDAGLRICEEVFALDAASRQRLTELLAL